MTLQDREPLPGSPADARVPAAAPSRRYLLITPCRDEAEHLPETIRTVAAQTVLPAKWIIVDDGSTDRTPEILADAARQHPFIEVVRRQDRGGRSVGPGVIEAFYEGLRYADVDQYDYLCKLDGDLRLPPRYFQRLLERMEDLPRVGTTSGKPYFRSARSGRRVPETCGDEMSVGMTKFYRVPCFRQIGGFQRAVMWDGIDCHRCRMLGWIAESRDGPDLRFEHLRPMGSSHRGIWTGRKRHGAGQYFMGTGPTFITASALFRLCRPPVVTGAVAMWWGYVSAMIRRAERYADPEFRRFLRRYQWEALLVGKAAAARLACARGESGRARASSSVHSPVAAGVGD